MKKYFLSLVACLALLFVFVAPSYAVTCSEDIYNVDLGFPLEGNPTDYEIFLPFGVAWCNDDGDDWGGSTTRHLGIDLKLIAENSDHSGDGDEKVPPTVVTEGRTVHASYDGTACKYDAGYSNGYHWGYGVYVRHEYGGFAFYTVYTHLASVDSDIVFSQSDCETGHPVSKGDQIGVVKDLDNSGIRDRDHLHYAMRCDDIGMNRKCGGGAFNEYDNDRCKNPLSFFKNIPEGKNPNIDKYFTRACQTYPDVSKDAWFYDAVEKLTWKGIVEGYSGGNFDPLGSVNRVEMIKMAVEASGKRCCDLCGNCSGCVNCGSISYNDVPDDQWYEKYLRVAHAEEWISQSSSNFYPGDGATRYWVAKVLVKAKKGWDAGDAPSNITYPFKDIQESPTCDPDDPYAWEANELGIFLGHFENECPSTQHPDGVKHPGTGWRYFCGEQVITRAEASTVTERAFLNDSSQQ